MFREEKHSKWSQQVVTASGHSKWSQQLGQQADPTLTQNTAQLIPNAPLELADLLGFCSWKVAWGLSHLDRRGVPRRGPSKKHPETMVDVGDETMATRTIEWVTQSLRLES